MEKNSELGPKEFSINPPLYLPILSNEWNAGNVKIERIDVSKWEGSDKFCVLLHNILSREECQQLANLADRQGFEKALVNVGGGKFAEMLGTRNHGICRYDDPHIADQIWQRVLKAAERDKTVHNDLLHIPWVNERCRHPQQVKPFRAVGLNENLRFLRYEAGQHFGPHVDGSYVRGTEAGIERYGEQSFVSFQLYLNEGFKGGATRFISEYDAYSELRDQQPPQPGGKGWSSPKKPLGHSIIPRAGSVLLFQHDCCHEGTRVESGRKYTIRSDVMYSTAGPGAEYAQRPLIARQFDDLY